MELKELLEEAAAAKGKTLSHELQVRLARTFTEDEKIADNFGDRQTYMLMRTIALAIQWSMLASRPKKQHWLDDPGWFDLAVKTINRLLEAVRPEGPLDDASDDAVEFNQRAIASALWQQVQAADPSAPIDSGTRMEHTLRLINDELADVAARSKPLDLTQMFEEIAAKDKPK
ncbi:Uncharacterized protein MLTONO_0389 [Mesorhizobium loti]|nr:Uncharacterized protein MLTONO_0389 [Mesorhizobium loti]